MQNMEFRTGVIQPVEVYKEAWEIMKNEYWLLLGIVLVGILIGSAVPVIIMGAMMCGIYMCLLNKVDGRPFSFEMLFKGFDYFGQSLLLMLIITVPTVIIMIASYLLMVFAIIGGAQLGGGGVVIFGIIAALIVLVMVVAMVCIHVLVTFALPLLVDKNMTAWPAITLSARAVRANLSGVVGLMLVGMGVALVGYMALCIGVYFVIPVIFMANAVAYRKVFPGSTAMGYAPPPPNAYQGL
jgi:hypothetical protein